MIAQGVEGVSFPYRKAVRSDADQAFPALTQRCPPVRHRSRRRPPVIGGILDANR